MFAENNKLKYFALNSNSSKVHSGFVKEGYPVGKLIGYSDYKFLFVASSELIKLYSLEEGTNSLKAIKYEDEKYGQQKLILFDKNIPNDTLILMIIENVVSLTIDKSEVEQLIKQLEL